MFLLHYPTVDQSRKYDSRIQMFEGPLRQPGQPLAVPCVSQCAVRTPGSLGEAAASQPRQRSSHAAEQQTQSGSPKVVVFHVRGDPGTLPGLFTSSPRISDRPIQVVGSAHEASRPLPGKGTLRQRPCHLCIAQSICNCSR